MSQVCTVESVGKEGNLFVARARLWCFGERRQNFLGNLCLLFPLFWPSRGVNCSLRLCLRLASASNLTLTSSNHYPMPLFFVQTEFRLEAVPEMGYSPSADPPAGEVCIRGPGIFTEYYKNKEMTKEAMGGLF